LDRARTVSSGDSAARRNVLMVLTVIHSDYGSGNTDYCPKRARPSVRATRKLSSPSVAQAGKSSLA
jgi:hypothetical protein